MGTGLARVRHGFSQPFAGSTPPTGLALRQLPGRTRDVAAFCPPPPGQQGPTSAARSPVKQRSLAAACLTTALAVSCLQCGRGRHQAARRTTCLPILIPGTGRRRREENIPLKRQDSTTGRRIANQACCVWPLPIPYSSGLDSSWGLCILTGRKGGLQKELL